MSADASSFKNSDDSALSYLALGSHTSTACIFVSELISAKWCRDPYSCVLCQYALEYLQDWPGARTFKPASPIRLKSAPKCLRVAFCKQTNPAIDEDALDRTLSNDFSWLWGAIIASCTDCATKELEPSYTKLTFLIPGLGLLLLHVSGTIDLQASREVFSPQATAFLQLLICLCYTQKHAQLDARAHEAP